MPTTKPIGPYQCLVKAESTALALNSFSWTADGIHILDVPDVGESKRVRDFIPISRPGRGRFHMQDGAFEDVSWSLTVPMQGSGTAGTDIDAFTALMQKAAGLSYNLYSGTALVTVVDYSAGGSDTVGVTVVTDSGTATTTLTEGSSFAAASDNTTTAHNIAAAIDAISGVTATHDGAIVTVTADDGTIDITLTTSDALAWSVTMGDNRCHYETDDDNPSGSASIYIVDRVPTRGEFLEGCIANNVTISYDKDDIKSPSIKFSGTAIRKYEIHSTTITPGINDAVTSMTLVNPNRITTGEQGTSESNLPFYVQLDSEVVKITAIDWTTGVATIARSQWGTSNASHSDNSVVQPPLSTITYPAGSIVGPELVSLSDGSTIKVRSFEISIETGRMYDEKQTGEKEPTAFKNGPIAVSGSITAIHSNSRSEYSRKLDAHTAVDFKFTLGTTSGSIFEINLNSVELSEKSVSRSLDDIETVTYNFVCKDNANSTGGQFQLICK